MRLGERYCSMCSRRDRSEGGIGSCPLARQLVADYKRRERELGEGHNCPSFTLGDARRKPPPSEQMELA